MNKLNVKKAKELLFEIREARTSQHLTVNDSLAQIEFPPDIDDQVSHYIPSRTSLKFHHNEDFVRVLMGPYGSGKSTACAAEIVMRTCAMPKCRDGVRRARWAVIRNTAAELESSTVKTWKIWFGNLGRVKQRKKPIYVLEHTFNDGIGVIELEIMFIACDREHDVNKFKSTEFTGAYLNEMVELPKSLLDMIKGRVNGRYPPKRLCEQPYWTGIIGDTNPCDTDHWFYDLFEKLRPDDYTLYKQPPGLIKDEYGEWEQNPEADNVENLSPTYYTKMANGADQEFVKVYCLGEYGIVRHAKPVYPQYNDDIHAVDDIAIDEGDLLLFGLDFGLTPAFLIAQVVNGQMRFIKEFCTDNMSAMELVPIVKGWLNVHAPNMPYQADHDPSNRGSDADNVKASHIWIDNGISTDPAITNNPIERMDSVKSYLNSLVNGLPGLIISKTGCPILRKGFMGDYHYKRVQVLGEERYKDVPNKIHPVSDIHDCAQYICLRQQNNFMPLDRPDHEVFDNTSFM